MFAYISGTIEHKAEGCVVIDNGGIGYKINTSLSTLARLGTIGEKVKVYTHYHVREDDISLFGFVTNEELNMFEYLITVSGVGPRVALSILSSISPSSFGLAVITNDAKALTKAQGVGIKLAQRIILELKDKIEKGHKEQIASGSLGDDFADPYLGQSPKLMEAISALVVLGYNQFEATKAVTNVFDENAEIEQIIMSALKSVSR